MHLGTKCQQEQYLCFCIGVNRNSEVQKVGTAGNLAKTCLGHPNVLFKTPNNSFERTDAALVKFPSKSHVS